MNRSLAATCLSIVLAALCLSPSDTPAHQPEDALNLDAWTGTWVGTMHSHGRVPARASTIDVEFTMTPLGEHRGYTWVMKYLDPERPVTKDYRLLHDDEHPGHWLMDERNGIVLSCRLTDGVLHGVFSLGEAVYTTRQERIGDELRFEVTMAQSISADDDEPGAVTSYRTIAVQSVTLRRKTPES